MPRKIAAKTDIADATTAAGDPAKTAPKPEAPKRTVIRAKTPMAWDALLKQADAEHWRKLQVVIQIRDKLLAGKPAALDAATAMLKARGLPEFAATAEDITDPQERADKAEQIAKDEGRCEFSRREGHPGIWIPSNNIKAGIKENWSVLGLRQEVRGSRGALAEGIFVAGDDKKGIEADWVRVGDAPSGVHVAVAHTDGPKGPMSSIKRHEYVTRPLITFYIWIANAKSVSEKISDDELARTFIHYGEHGAGACRSQGFGKFDVVSIKEIEQNAGAPPEGAA